MQLRTKKNDNNQEDKQLIHKNKNKHLPLVKHKYVIKHDPSENISEHDKNVKGKKNSLSPLKIFQENQKTQKLEHSSISNMDNEDNKENETINDIFEDKNNESKKDQDNNKINKSKKTQSNIRVKNSNIKRRVKRKLLFSKTSGDHYAYSIQTFTYLPYQIRQLSTITARDQQCDQAKLSFYKTGNKLLKNESSESKWAEKFSGTEIYIKNGNLNHAYTFTKNESIKEKDIK